MKQAKFQCYLLCLLSIFESGVHHILCSASRKCPDPESIYPCFCSNEDGDSWVQCNNLNDEKLLRMGLTGLKGYDVWKLSVFVNNHGTIDSSLFEGLKVERLELENTTVTLESPQLKGLENSLDSLLIKSCYNDNHLMSGWSLKHLTRLRELIVENNVIQTLRNDWIKSAPASLRSVTVENNAIEEMEDKVFSEMKWLTFLFLEQNHLTTLKRSMLPRPAANLRTINLNNNKIKYLPNDIFEDIPNLRGVDLENNLLTTLDDAVWRPVIKQLTRLNVEENPIACDEKLRWMFSHPSVLSALEGRCQKPEKLKNKQLSDLTDGDLK